MRIKYDSTIDEAVNTELRLCELLKTVRKSKWEGLIFALLLFVGVYFSEVREQIVRFVSATIASVIFIIWYLGTYKKTLKKRIRRIILEIRGTDKPIPTEFEFNEDGLIFRQLGTEIKYQWYTVKNISENDEVVEFTLTNIVTVIIPKRIFENDQQKNEWLNYAKQRTKIS